MPRLQLAMHVPPPLLEELAKPSRMLPLINPLGQGGEQHCSIHRSPMVVTEGGNALGPAGRGRSKQIRSNPLVVKEMGPGGTVSMVMFMLMECGRDDADDSGGEETRGCATASR